MKNYLNFPFAIFFIVFFISQLSLSPAHSEAVTFAYCCEKQSANGTCQKSWTNQGGFACIEHPPWRSPECVTYNTKKEFEENCGSSSFNGRNDSGCWGRNGAKEGDACTANIIITTLKASYQGAVACVDNKCGFVGKDGKPTRSTSTAQVGPLY